MKSKDVKILFQKALEINSKKKMYCQNPKCAKFICLDYYDLENDPNISCNHCGQ